MGIVNYTKEEIAGMKSETDWDRLLSMKEEDIIIDGDSPDVVAGIKSGRMKVRGRPRLQDKKVPISIRLEPDTLESLRALGPGWQTELSNKISDWVRVQHTDAPR